MFPSACLPPRPCNRPAEPDGGNANIKFTRIRLKNWKNFANAGVQLQRRMFVVGPNAIGKSNFLDAFRFLRDLVVEGGAVCRVQ